MKQLLPADNNIVAAVVVFWLLAAFLTWLWYSVRKSGL